MDKALESERKIADSILAEGRHIDPFTQRVGQGYFDFRGCLKRRLRCRNRALMHMHALHAYLPAQRRESVPSTRRAAGASKHRGRVGSRTQKSVCVTDWILPMSLRTNNQTLNQSASQSTIQPAKHSVRRSPNQPRSLPFNGSLNPPRKRAIIQPVIRSESRPRLSDGSGDWSFW